MKEVIFKLPDDVLTLIIHKVENTPQEASLLEKWIYDGEERKTGKWVPQYASEPHWTGFVVLSYKCSCCGGYYIPPYRTKYCPNCGAKMEVDE